MNHHSTDTAPTVLDSDFSLPARELSDLLNGQPPPIDYEKMFECCLENVAFAQMLLREFQATATERIETIIRHIEHSQPVDAAYAAHSLQGMTGILGATALLNVAHEIDSAGSTADLPRLHDLIPALRAELQRCLDDIPQFLERFLMMGTSSE